MSEALGCAGAVSPLSGQMLLSREVVGSTEVSAAVCQQRAVHVASGKLCKLAQLRARLFGGKIHSFLALISSIKMYYFKTTPDSGSTVSPYRGVEVLD